MEKNAPRTIMLVDDSGTNLLAGKAALSENYKVQTVGSAALMLEALEWGMPDLILLDVDMPEMDGFEAIKILKERQETQGIPVIFLTAMNDAASELKGLELGAVDYIIKPFSPPLLRKRVELHLLLKDQKAELQNYNDNLQHMVEEKTQTILKLQNKLLTAMAEIVESRDDVTGNHIARTRQLLKILIYAVIESGMYKEEASGWNIELLCQSCQLHDVGKIAIPDSLLKKPGKLTPEEFAEMKQHVAIGVEFITSLESDDDDSAFFSYAKTFVKYHHEKWDGTGYLLGLSGEDIPLLGRMMAIIDVYDALVSDRPYKRAFAHGEAVNIIIDSAGTHFDPTLVKLFEQVSDQFHEPKIS